MRPQPREFIHALQQVKFNDVFNPYSDRCELNDLKDAPQRRCSALFTLLSAASQSEIDSLWLGRDLGYRGGRRTGLALTDDVHIEDHAARWGVYIERATAGPMMAERTAAVIWNAIRHINRQIFLWNVFPFHPYETDNPFTNRSHNLHERVTGQKFLSKLIDMLKPARLVALGNDAAAVARGLSCEIEVIHVRHPSYGGQREFMAQIQSLYGFVANP